MNPSRPLLGIDACSRSQSQSQSQSLSTGHANASRLAQPPTGSSVTSTQSNADWIQKQNQKRKQKAPGLSTTSSARSSHSKSKTQRSTGATSFAIYGGDEDSYVDDGDTSMTSSAQYSRSNAQSNTGKNSRSMIVAIVEGRGVGAEVGICFLDLKTSECILSQIADSQTYVKTVQKLGVFCPSEILVPSTAVQPIVSKLVKVLRENHPSVNITPLPRRFFNESTGLDFIKQYIVPDGCSTFIVAVASKYFCLAATAAALKHMEMSKNSMFINHSVRFTYQGCQGSMMIDCATARNLELTINLANPHRKHSLFGVLNHTQTPMGSRLLRTNILQPSKDANTINARLDCVEELTHNEEKFYAVQQALKTFIDTDHLITSFIQVPSSSSAKHSEQSINNMILLKHALRRTRLLSEALEGCQSQLLRTIHHLLNDERLTNYSALIDGVIDQDAVFQKTAIGLRNQRCFAVKAGCNGLLDVARQTYKEIINDIFEAVNSYVEQYGFALKVQFNAKLGYHLQTTVDQLGGEELPMIFINVVKKNRTLAFTTLEIVKKNTKIADSLTEVYLMSDKIVADLSTSIRADIGAMYKASEAIALLDMLTAFAHQCTLSEYVRPEISDTLVIKQGRHPIREILYTDRYVPNDTYASLAHSFQVITGPNMSGKSTYLRQVALLSIMAQIGSFVPAEFCAVRLVDQLFTRICNDDSIEFNSSTFMVEMKETAYILENVSNHGLVVIDELGRGTSTHDGLGITFAVCEELARTEAFVFFATHFHELAGSLSAYHNVVNLHLETHVSFDKQSRSSIQYKYKLADGRVTEDHYGLVLAQSMNLPEDITETAWRVSRRLEELSESSRSRAESNKVLLRRRALAQLVHRLKLIQKSKDRLTSEGLLDALRSIQNDAVSTFSALQTDDEDAEDLDMSE